MVAPTGDADEASAFPALAGGYADRFCRPFEVSDFHDKFLRDIETSCLHPKDLKN